MTTTDHATRRALLTVGAAALAMPLAALATPTTGVSEDERFLAWERDALWARGNEDADRTDDELDEIIAAHHVIQRLILDTPSAGLTPARVKASTLERIAREDDEGQDIVLAHIVAALRAAGAR